ncbi:MAG TPA: hypothetical protein VM143_00215 [Acidimicrobiales bacterium]|nr:hypothetical protein [Acidimicrobiales bacterium]
MTAQVEPAELAALLDVAERPRAEQWSLRAALTRYAQPQPDRASAVIELVRRIDSALRPHAKRLERDGPALWRAATGVAPADGGDDEAATFVAEVLRALVELDRLGDGLAAWAVDRAGERPDAVVDEIVGDVTARLERLGIEREERPRPAYRRG